MTEQITTPSANGTNDADTHNLDSTESYNFAYLDEQTKRMIRRATPPVDMKVDARIKKGIASSV